MDESFRARKSNAPRRARKKTKILRRLDVSLLFVLLERVKLQKKRRVISRQVGYELSLGLKMQPRLALMVQRMRTARDIHIPQPQRK